MNFVNTQFLTLALVAIIFIAILLNRLNSKFFKWIKTYWFYERTWVNKISAVLYLLSLLLLLLSLLDLRGPERKVKASLPDQRTIILIDTSASMLAEDVRPSRFVKSIQLARHFVKNAPGHQISVVLFSDIQKRLIPFTDDIDLIDSRLAALEKTNTVAGGSNISQAIEEAIQYFDFDSSEDDKTKSGNMLVFTDAEESEGEFKVHIPSNINLAMVGVGTLKGANIPLRWEDGSFRGYKTFKGEPVITKLDEAYIQKMGKNIKSFKYWIANSYSLPTEELMNFFRSTYMKKQSTGDMRIRPVYSHYILIPAILIYCLSVLLGRFALFKTAKQAILIFSLGLGLGITSVRAEDKPKEKAISPELQKDLELIKEGKADRKFILKVAEKILKSNDDQRASELYSEYFKKDDAEEVKFNYATSLMKTNRVQESLPYVQDLLKNSKNESLKSKLRNNLLLSLDDQKQKDKDKNKDKDKEGKDKKQDKNDQDKKDKDNKENKDKKDKKDTKDQNKQDQKKEGGKNSKDDKKQDGPNKKPDKEGKKDDKNEKDKDKDKKDGKDKDKDKDKGKEEEKEAKQPSGPSTLEEKEKEIEQKRKMVKTPAMIKQILSDDRELQKKMMDTSTSERGEQKPKRDW
jgi:Ca-activated chloride channel family protein